MYVYSHLKKFEGSNFCVPYRPVSYSVPDDGPVGDLLEKLGRHPFRPAHLHIRIEVSRR